MPPKPIACTETSKRAESLTAATGPSEVSAVSATELTDPRGPGAAMCVPSPNGMPTPASVIQTHLCVHEAQNTTVSEATTLQIADRVAEDRQISVSDPEMRHGRKSKTERIQGYKRYVASDLDQRLVLSVAVLPANVPEFHGGDVVYQQAKMYGPVLEARIDRGFLASAFVAELDAQKGTIVGRPYPDRPAVEGGFAKRDFVINLESKTVQCPAGQIQPLQSNKVHFPDAVCRTCELRPQCQKPDAKYGRTVNIHPQEALMKKLQQYPRTVEGRAQLRQRTAIEHDLAHLVFRQGDQARYRGTRKNTYDLHRSAVVYNLQTMDHRLQEAKAA
jgi:hypothetical protein